MPEPRFQAALILIGGAVDISLAAFARSHSLIICADSGAEHARSMALVPQAIVGDLDSISDDTQRYFEGLGTGTVRVHNQDQDDFEKSLAYLSTFYRGEVDVLGLTGLRTDHALTNLSVMLRWSNGFERLTAIDAFASYQFLTTTRNEVTIAATVGQLISLIPFGVAKGVTTTNLQYALTAEDLTLGEREGLSNVATKERVHISIEEGALLVISARN